MASSDYIYLENLQNFLDRYTLPSVLLLGNLTNIANAYLFSRRNLKDFACSRYFICLSICHLLLMNTICISRIFIGWNNYDYAASSLIYCKIRSYLFSLTLMLSRYFIGLISIDRWLVTSSSAWLRNQSSLAKSRSIILGSILFWSIYEMHALIGYQNNRFGCYPPPGTTYSVFASVDAIVTTLSPLVIMIVFSALTLINLRVRIIRQIHPFSHPSARLFERERNRSKRNMQLIRLSILQVIVFIILNSPWTTFAIFVQAGKTETFGYMNLISLNIFLNGFGLFFLFIYSGITFFIYTLASSTFRKECKITCLRSWNFIKQFIHHPH